MVKKFFNLRKPNLIKLQIKFNILDMKVNNKNYIHPWQKKPTISKSTHIDKKPTWTLVMPAFNQEENILTVLDKIYKMACYPFEIILIDDGFSDKTLKNMKEFCFNLNKFNKKIVTSTIIHNKLPIFETACDNQGFKLAKAQFIIEVQADIHIEERDFDKKNDRCVEKIKFIER
jgi:glycosyltransferase involved in cell wall biosynthesis